MTLNLLPRDLIKKRFEALTKPIRDAKAKPGGVYEKLQKFYQYFDNTWLKSDIWDIAEWCVCNMTIRTNNDLEGICTAIIFFQNPPYLVLVKFR